jgi:small subunit ribosomal protein S15
LEDRTAEDMPFVGLVTRTHAMLSKKKKQNVIKKYQTHKEDTGSSEVQIAILTSEIDELVKHLKAHHKDHSSRRGLLRKVGERRRLLRYLKKENPKSYEQLVKDLKLKQAKTLTKTEPDKEKKDETKK